MDFFNDLGKRFSSVARSMTEKARESGEISRISDDLKNATAELERLYCAFGKACYNVRQGKGDAAAIDALAKQIQSQLRQIDALSAQRDDLSQARRCPNCGAVQARDARFCAACGKRLPEESPVADDAVANARYCPACGAMIDKDAAVCEVCGKRFIGAQSSADEAPEGAGPASPIGLEEPEDAECEMEE